MSATVAHRILTVNVGSSSLRLALFVRGHDGFRREASHHVARRGTSLGDGIRTFLDHLGQPAIAVAVHRVVHGGPELAAPAEVTRAVEAAIRTASELAPLHNPPALEGLVAARHSLGTDTRHVAVFDTAFFAELPAVARHYALPRELVRQHRLRRYGFHGLAHQALWRRWHALSPDRAQRPRRLITLQLGAGCSAAAIRDGRPLDTSMGFTPLEGLMMATRSGDVDPGLLTYLLRTTGMPPDALDTLLNRSSGLLGVSGLSGDVRKLLAAEDTQPAVRLALDLFCYRVRKVLGAYLAVLGGAEAIVFGGGVGEHAAPLRERILRDMDWCGIRLDPARNAAADPEQPARISADDAGVAVWVIPVDEADEQARAALPFLPDAKV